MIFDARPFVDLVLEKFYGDLTQSLPKRLGFTAESIAPTMMSDGLVHYKLVRYSDGRIYDKHSTTIKPNDMLDAISATHIYRKNIIQAEV